MTDNEIRAAIAETQVYERREDGFWREVGHVGSCGIPNYPGDLNACAEFERTLPDEERMSYGKQLQRVLLTSAEENAWLLSATARQRCEAFLRVKGLWRE